MPHHQSMNFAKKAADLSIGANAKNLGKAIVTTGMIA